MKEYCKETGCAMIVITHSLQQAKRIADEILFFHKGIVLEHGEKEQVLQTPATKEFRQFIEFYGV
jgi:ABC-type phosphate transport system ATPase subunit